MKTKTKKVKKSEGKVKKKGAKKYKPTSYGTGFPGRWKSSKKWLINDLDVLMGKAVVTQVGNIK